MKDTIFDNLQNNLVDFRFDKQVANVFSDMVTRSVPAYQTMIQMITLFAEKYAQENSNFYDLGCSLGAVSLALDIGRNNKDIKIISVDNSEAMLEKCKKNLSNLKNNDIICADINNLDINNASIVVLNLTLQFIAIEHRQQLINKIYQGMNKNSVLIISEKIHFATLAEEKIQNALQINFKRANSYSKLAISQKRTAIENTLITDDKETHLTRLEKAGFKHCFSWFQCFNFSSFCAIKT